MIKSTPDFVIEYIRRNINWESTVIEGFMCCEYLWLPLLNVSDDFSFDFFLVKNNDWVLGCQILYKALCQGLLVYIYNRKINV